MESKDNSLKNIEEKILSFLKANPSGVTQEKLFSAIPFEEDLILNSLNSLNESNRLNILESSDGIIFKYRNEKEAKKLKDLSKEEITVYQIIMQSGSNGINIVDIKSKMKINNTTYVNRILTKLSKKKYLIKDVKVLNSKNKKVWMGIDIVPSQEITGGIWCSDQKFDNKLVSIYCEKCAEYIGTQKQATRKEILFFAKSINLIGKSSEIKEDDIQKILNILVFDGKIEPIFPISYDTNFGNKYAILIDKGHPDQELIKYKKVKEYNRSNIYECLPCFVCPSFNECKKNNVVNPIDCPYNKVLFNDIEE